MKMMKLNYVKKIAVAIYIVFWCFFRSNDWWLANILSADFFHGVSNDDESRWRMSCMSCQEKSGLEIKKIRLSLQDTPGMLKMCTIRVYAQHIGHFQDEDEDGDMIWWLWSHVVGAVLVAAHWFDFWKSIPCDVITHGQARVMKVTMTWRPSICQECGHAAQQRIQEEAEYLR